MSLRRSTVASAQPRAAYFSFLELYLISGTSRFCKWATESYELDSNGDVLLILRNPKPSLAVWDEAEDYQASLPDLSSPKFADETVDQEWAMSSKERREKKKASRSYDVAEPEIPPPPPFDEPPAPCDKPPVPFDELPVPFDEPLSPLDEAPVNIERVEMRFDRCLVSSLISDHHHYLPHHGVKRRRCQ